MGSGLDAPRLSVFVRKRPLAKKELKAKGYDILTCLYAGSKATAFRTELMCHEPKLKVDCSESLENHQFHFDGVFDELQDNTTVYSTSVGPLIHSLVPSVSNGSSSNGPTSLTVFAYGQTGSGKTYTMKSIYRQAASDLFERLSATGGPITVGVSFYEIYMNHVNDLLSGRARVQLMEDGDGTVQLLGLKEVEITSSDELMALIQAGEQSRATSANAVHDDSSRSHALLRVTISSGSTQRQVLSRLSMVDLAGSERACDTQSDSKNTRMEGAEINKSLLALKECIRALDRGATHIPFRQSKLTQLLRDSFLCANSKTVMIATVSPWSESCNHTLNTLRSEVTGSSPRVCCVYRPLGPDHRLHLRRDDDEVDPLLSASASNEPSFLPPEPASFTSLEPIHCLTLDVEAYRDILHDHEESVLEERMQFLKGCRVFQGCGEDVLLALAAVSGAKVYDPGKNILRIGDVVTQLYVIKRGVCQVRKTLCVPAHKRALPPPVKSSQKKTKRRGEEADHNQLTARFNGGGDGSWVLDNGWMLTNPRLVNNAQNGNKDEPMIWEDVNIAILASGQVFGELSVLQPGQSSQVTIHSQTLVEILVFEQADLARLNIQYHSGPMNALQESLLFHNPPQQKIIQLQRDVERWEKQKKSVLSELSLHLPTKAQTVLQGATCMAPKKPAKKQSPAQTALHRRNSLSPLPKQLTGEIVKNLTQYSPLSSFSRHTQSLQTL
ncbi:hypothetical protein Poli38472_007387 [Pythium oligandrum]|uniref:Kinesin-like protein n=1 Tax=Pythium oligandrum TaxID=41045 RepID=A0A8K1C9V5_PYTOL|nr:hypothetical protein Poli38472_007387 [Pythium oligandrum]|eukprot:TMW59242.1 hypothetical protein Poli38472_007387 [Pythium oligandrum]